MLKIYFDWNCITHSKNIYPYILNIAEECGDRFIFPFSITHIRDLMVSHNKENKYFDSDLDLLERICTKHYLLFEDGQMRPKFATPKEVIDVSGDELEMIQKIEFISPETYLRIKQQVKDLLPSDIYNKIQGAEPKDVISTIDKYISRELPTHNLESLQVSQGQVIDILIIGAFFNSYSLQYYSFWKGKIGFARTVPVSWTTPMSIASVTVDS